MSTQIRSVPFFKPQGIDGSLTSEAPWNILINLMPHESGLKSAPRHNFVTSSSGDHRASGLLFDGHTAQMFTLSYGAATKNLIFRACTDTGKLYSELTYTMGSGTHGLEPEDWQSNKEYSYANLNGRLFMCGGGRVICVFGTGDTYVRSKLACRPTLFNQRTEIKIMEWEAGASAAAWPYLAELTRASIAEAHNGRVFYAGFNEGTVLKFDASMTSAQQQLLGDFVASSTEVRLGPASFCFTDANNPFSIGLPNFVQIGSKYPIRALASHKDRLFILTAGDIWTLDGIQPEEFTVRPLASAIGCQDFKTAVSTPHGLFFAGPQGIFLTDGESVAAIDQQIDHLFDAGISWPATFAEIGGSFRLDRRFGHMAYNAEQDELWIPVFSPTAGGYYHCLVYRVGLQAWTLVSAPWGPGGGGAFSFQFVRPTSLGTKFYYSYISGGGAATGIVLLVEGGKYQTAHYLALTKPFAGSMQNVLYAQAVNVVYRRGFEGGATVYYVGNTGRAYIWDSSLDYDHSVAALSEVLPLKFEHSPSSTYWNETGTPGKWNTMKWTRKARYDHRMNMHADSKYVMFGIYGHSDNAVHIDGMELLYRVQQDRETD